MTTTQIAHLLFACGLMALTFWGWNRRRHRRESGDKTADYFVQDGIDTTGLAPNEFVTVAQFAVSLDAEMARLKLEGDGIESVIYGDRATGGGRNLLIGPGVELKVKAGDAARAAEVLREM